jgi:hypothetical protein
VRGRPHTAPGERSLAGGDDDRQDDRFVQDDGGRRFAVATLQGPPQTRADVLAQGTAAR